MQKYNLGHVFGNQNVYLGSHEECGHIQVPRDRSGSPLGYLVAGFPAVLTLRDLEPSLEEQNLSLSLEASKMAEGRVGNKPKRCLRAR